jgi:AraC family transcriptional regulator
LYRYIQWLRLRHASWRLAFNPQDKVIDIALGAGLNRQSRLEKRFQKSPGHFGSPFGNARLTLTTYDHLPRMRNEKANIGITMLTFPDK